MTPRLRSPAPARQRKTAPGFDEVLARQARTLRARRDERGYRDGDALALARLAVDRLDPADHRAWLAWLVEARVTRFLLGDCDLDPTAIASYGVIDQVAEQINAAIDAEGAPVLDVLRAWAGRYVDDYADLLREEA